RGTQRGQLMGHTAANATAAPCDHMNLALEQAGAKDAVVVRRGGHGWDRVRQGDEATLTMSDVCVNQWPLRLTTDGRDRGTSLRCPFRTGFASVSGPHSA